MSLPHYAIVAGRIMFDMAKPDRRAKAWHAFGKLGEAAKAGSPFAQMVKHAIATIARKLMQKSPSDANIGQIPASTQLLLPLRPRVSDLSRSRRDDMN